jgi:hypothetical protein
MDAYRPTHNGAPTTQQPVLHKHILDTMAFTTDYAILIIAEMGIAVSRRPVGD